MSDVEFRGDPDLESHEKETVIRFDKTSDEALVHTFSRTLAKWLHKHPDTYIHFYNTDAGTVRSILENDVSVVYGVKADIPVGCLKMSGKPRKDHTMSGIVGKLPDKESV